MSSERIIDLYERNAGDFDRERGRSLQEKAWLDAFLSHVPPTGIVLDIGCGMAEPIARYIIERGFGVAGVDSSPSLIDFCRARFRKGSGSSPTCGTWRSAGASTVCSRGTASSI